jgi:anti-sigma regulatory factor (Ser/Thr protein kinase)
MTVKTAEPPMFLKTYPAVPESITSARRVVRTLCIKWRLNDGTVEAAELATSELVTNAYKAAHETGDTFELRVRLSGLRVRVQVWDRSDDKPEEGHVSPDATGGRGLLIVSILARNWGVSVGEGARGGKWVWAVL